MRKRNQLKAAGLTSHIGFWMRRVSNHVSHSFARKLEASGVTVAEWVVLREMYGADGTTSPSVIAGLTGMSRGAISKLVTRLLEKGLVARRESADDRRYQDIKLTEKAKGLVPKLSALADKNDELFFAQLPAEERAQLKRTLEKLASIHQLKTMPVE